MNKQRQHFTKRRIGDKVRLIRNDSIKHRQAIGAPITGVIYWIDLDHRVGHIYRPFLIRFDDGHSSWWSSNEIRKVK